MSITSEYSVVDASFFARNPPVSRRFTSGGIATHLPMAKQCLYSSHAPSVDCIAVVVWVGGEHREREREREKRGEERARDVGLGIREREREGEGGYRANIV